MLKESVQGWLEVAGEQKIVAPIFRE
jgi:hypothetical protein